MKILITGITGQDGRFLADYLLNQGHEVHGTLRPRTQSFPTWKTEVLLHYVDMTDLVGMGNLVRRERFDEVYNLAAQSHVGESFDYPVYTMRVNAVAAINLMDLCRDTPFYQASTSEMFGDQRNSDGRISESTPMIPNSPYGVAKLAAHSAVRVNRVAHASPHYAGILFNHESHLRGDQFVTKKVVNYVLSDSEKPLELGNIAARRDWGYAGDYVEAMVHILRDQKGDYVVATGESFSVKDWVSACFSYVGKPIKWSGSMAYDEEGLLRVRGNTGVHNRPLDIDVLCGDPSLVKKDLGWESRYRMLDLVKDMVEKNDAHSLR